jgi:hypothetical protein
VSAKLAKWDTMHEFLVKDKQLKSISPEEAQVRTQWRCSGALQMMDAERVNNTLSKREGDPRARSCVAFGLVGRVCAAAGKEIFSLIHELPRD